MVHWLSSICRRRISRSFRTEAIRSRELPSCRAKLFSTGDPQAATETVSRGECSTKGTTASMKNGPQHQNRPAPLEQGGVICQNEPPPPVRMRRQLQCFQRLEKPL